MDTQIYSYLKFVHFRNLQEWDLKRYFIEQVKSPFAVINLQKVIEEQNTKYNISDAKKDYGILGVNNQIGIFDAYTENGSKIQQKYKKMEQGWIAYNPYRINVGSIGVKKENHKNEFISPAYVVFSCTNNVLPEFLFLTMKTYFFHKQICDNTTGSVRQNLSFEILKTLQIPLPSLSEQNALIADYNAKMLQVAALETQAAEIEANIESYLFEILGINNAKTQKHNNKNGFLQMVCFKDLNVWGVEQNLNENNNFLHSNIYKNNTLGDILSINPTTNISTLNEDDEMSFIPMECISDKYGEWIADNKLIGTKLKSKGYTKFQNGDLIWARITPCMQNGKSAIVDNLQNGFGYGSTEFHVIRNLREDINLKYIHLLLRCQIVLKKAMSYFTGSAGQQRVPKSFLENLNVPLPPLSIQNEIVTNISAQKEIIKAKKLQAEALRREALTEFEKSIFE